MEVVELRPGDLAAPYPVHRGSIPAPPRVGEGGPVHVEVLRSAELLTLSDDGGAPVYNRAEDVEDERGRGWPHQSCSAHVEPSTPARREGRMRSSHPIRTEKSSLAGLTSRRTPTTWAYSVTVSLIPATLGHSVAVRASREGERSMPVGI